MFNIHKGLLTVAMIMAGLVVVGLAIQSLGTISTTGPASGSGAMATYIVGFDDLAPAALASAEHDVAGIVTSSGGTVQYTYTVINGLSVSIPASAVGRINAAPGVSYVEKDEPMRLQLDQVARQLDVNPAWDGTWDGSGTALNGSGILIGIIDSGVDTSHPDLAGKIVKQVYFTNPSIAAGIEATDIAEDPDGHGTFVASEIVGSGVSSYPTIALKNGELHTSLKGIAPGAKIISARVSYPDGSSSTSEMLKGLDWIYNYGRDHPDTPVRIISISLAGKHQETSDGRLPAIEQAIKNCYDHDIVVVAGAGNEGPGAGTVLCPGDSTYAITVGSVDRNDEVSYFSSRGPGAGNLKPDVVAAGRNVVAARPQTSGSTNFDRYYTTMSGTSMATPEVSGIVALLLQANPGLEPGQVKDILQITARKPAGVAKGQDPDYGFGIVDAAAALKYMKTYNPGVIDRPVATVSFNRTGYQVSEDAGSLAVNVSVAWQDTTKGPINITYSAQGDTAIAGQDFEQASGTLMFTPNDATEQTLAIAMINNHAPGNDKYFSLKLASAENVVFAPAVVKVTVSEVDNAIVLFDAASYTVKQGHNSVVVDVVCDRSKVSADARSTVKVSYKSQNGSMLSGSNYAEAQGTLTFGQENGIYPDIITKNFTVNINSQGWASAGDEYFYLQLSNATNATLGSPNKNKVWVVFSPAKIDTTPPVVSSSVTPGTPPADGWYTTSVQVSLAATDGGSGVQSREYRLNFGPWLDYTSPLVILDEGTNVIEYTGKDKAGNLAPTQSLSLKIDVSPPTATAVVDKELPAAGFYESPVHVSLAAGDGDGSGVKCIWYSLDAGTTWTNYTGGPILIGTSGETTFKYNATDNLGHMSDVKTLMISINPLTPATTCTLIPAIPQSNGWYTTEVNVTLGTSFVPPLGLKLINYSLNNGAWQTYTGPFNVSADGLTVIGYQGISNAGNVETPNSRVVNIDRTLPVLGALAVTQDAVVPGLVTVNADFVEQFPATIVWQWGDGSDVTSGNFTGNTVNGSHVYATAHRFTITGTLTDKAGHTGSSMFMFTVGESDHIAPTTTCAPDSAPPASGWYNSSVALTLAATDNAGGSGVDYTNYSLDDGATWLAYSAPVVIDTEGTTVLKYRSTDRAGNIESGQNVTVKLDKTAPISNSPVITPALNLGWINQTVTVALSATDDRSGLSLIEYQLNGGAWTTYTVPFPVSNAGMNTVVYRAKDNASNVEGDRTQSIGIDTTAPTVTYATSPAGPNPDGFYYGPVVVTFTATDTGGSGVNGSATSTQILTGPGTGLTATARFRDDAGNYAPVCTFGPITIKASAVAIDPIGGLPSSPQALGTGVTVNPTCKAYTPNAIVSANWSWDDGTFTMITTGLSSGAPITASHKYTKTGVYSVNLTVRDSQGNWNLSKYDYVVVYDPKGGTVVGAGLANSPPGAYYPDPGLTGTDIFGFFSRYLKGATVPTGVNEFIFHSGRYWYDDVWFTSTSNDWLVISGKKAYYQGSGCVWDGTSWVSGHKFLVSMIDGGSQTDKFRARIWKQSTGVVIYDNLFDATADADPTTPIKAGNLLILK